MFATTLHHVILAGRAVDFSPPNLLPCAEISQVTSKLAFPSTMSLSV